METSLRSQVRPVHPSRLRRLRRVLTVYVFLPWAAVTLLMTVFQRQLMYQPTSAGYIQKDFSDRFSGRIRDLQLTTPDGAVLRGWLLHAESRTPQMPQSGLNDQRDAIPQALDSRRPLLIYFPGNAGNRFLRFRDLTEFSDCGTDVLIVDYRGYGDSTGSPTEPRLTADARLIWDLACGELAYPPDRIVLFGESLGGAVALSLWSEEPPWPDESHYPPQPAAVLLNATFASMQEAVAWHYPWFPFRYLVLDTWPSIQRIRRVPESVPIIIFHGTADRIVPVEQGRSLAAAAPNAKLHEIPGGEHNDIPMLLLRRELRKYVEPPGDN